MKRTIAIAAVILSLLAAPAYALYTVNEKGDWPATWPKALEPLRKQARTLVGPEVAQQHFAIRFTKREELEAAWPELLKVKTKGAPVFLLRRENFFLGEGVKAGVIVRAPPEGQHKNPATPEAPIPGVQDLRMRWMNTTYIELVVDGDIVDLNRLPLPDETPIIDERFNKDKK